jgi:hypothetical protein
MKNYNSNPTGAPVLQNFVKPGLSSFVNQTQPLVRQQPTTPVVAPHAGKVSVGSHKSRRRIVGHKHK